MNDKIRFLGKPDELQFAERKFRGKLAGKKHNYNQSLQGVIRTRAIIFIMALVVFVPVVINYFLHEAFLLEVLVERAVLSGLLIVAGLLYNKFRIAAIILSCIPVLLILYLYSFGIASFNLNTVAFNIAILVLLLLGIYHHVRMQSMRKQLEGSLLENQLSE